MIIPALLEKDWPSIEKKLKICENFAASIHVDFIDGNFFHDKNFLDIEKFKEYSSIFRFEAHLMVDEPINYLDRLFDSGFKTFIGQIEKMSDQVAFVAKAQEFGGVGLALDLDTPLKNISINKDDLDKILLLSVKAGFSGQKFDERVLEKIRELREEFLNVIEIDGGLNPENLSKSKIVGADSFCVNSNIFSSPNPEEQFRKLEMLL
jgi:ribulose-phosphate 3-epimerase